MKSSRQWWCCCGQNVLSEEKQMPRWLRDKMTWVVVLAAIAAASSSYSAYKLYQMTDGRPAPTKSISERAT